MTLWVMRHPRVVLPVPTCYGRSDVPVDEAHARQCVAAVLQQIPELTRIVTSEMRRTCLVAEAVCQARPGQVQCRIDRRLNEMDFGEYEMQPWDAIPKPAVDAWVVDFPRHRFGGKECVQDVIDRTASLWHETQGQAQAGDVLWICHAGIGRALQFLQTHADGVIRSVDEWPRNTLDFGQLRAVSWP